MRSLRQVSFVMYVDALRELAVWFHALDHTNYARLIPVHLRDIVELPTIHLEVAEEFQAGNLTVQKTNRPFSAELGRVQYSWNIAIDVCQRCSSTMNRYTIMSF